MVGFRNILGYDHAKPDPAIVVRVLSHNADDILQFRDRVSTVV